MNLDINITGKLSTKSVKVAENECASCGRILKSPSEWIRGESYVICEPCYRNFLYPNGNDCNSDFF